MDRIDEIKVRLSELDDQIEHLEAEWSALVDEMDQIESDRDKFNAAGVE